jgi:hypothetical protein
MPAEGIEKRRGETLQKEKLSSEIIH